MQTQGATQVHDVQENGSEAELDTCSSMLAHKMLLRCEILDLMESGDTAESLMRTA